MDGELEIGDFSLGDFSSVVVVMNVVVVVSTSTPSHLIFMIITCVTLHLLYPSIRYHGEITQGESSLAVFGESVKTMHYHRMYLLKLNLITKQVHTQRGMNNQLYQGSLLMLKRCLFVGIGHYGR